MESIDRRQNSNNTNTAPRTLERPHLLGKPWYYGSVTRAQCDSLLNQQGHDGDFLIRDSETNVCNLKILYPAYFKMIQKDSNA